MPQFGGVHEYQQCNTPMASVGTGHFVTQLIATFVPWGRFGAPRTVLGVFFLWTGGYHPVIGANNMRQRETSISSIVASCQLYCKPKPKSRGLFCPILHRRP